MQKLQPFDDDRCWCTNLGTIIVRSNTCPLGPVAAGVPNLIVTFDLDLPFTIVKAIREGRLVVVSSWEPTVCSTCIHLGALRCKSVEI